MSTFTARLRALAISAALAAAAILTVSAPAAAHDALVDSTPKEGATLTSAPSTIELRYSGQIMPDGVAAQVVDASGKDWIAGAPSVEGETVTVPVNTDMPGGAYTVNWRVVSQDGHPIEGALPFTLDLPAAQPTAAPTADPSVAPIAAPTADATPEPTMTTLTETSQDSGAGTALMWAAIGVGVAAVVVIAVALARRKSNPPA